MIKVEQKASYKEGKQQMNDRIFNRLTIEINKAYYTCTRYKILSTFAYLYHEKELTPAELGNFVRISDQFLQVDEHHYFINFSHTEQDGAFKASQNLLLYLDKHFNTTTSCIAIDTFNVSQSPKIVLNRLVQILDETRKNSYTRIEDEDILNGII